MAPALSPNREVNLSLARGLRMIILHRIFNAFLIPLARDLRENFSSKELDVGEWEQFSTKSSLALCANRA